MLSNVVPAAYLKQARNVSRIPSCLCLKLLVRATQKNPRTSNGIRGLFFSFIQLYLLFTIFLKASLNSR